MFCVVPLDIGGVTVEGLRLRITAHQNMPDRNVTIQLECSATRREGGPIARIEWRSPRKHNNKGRGPKELRHVLQGGTHHHKFDLNWKDNQKGMLERGELKIAVPLDPDPKDFHALMRVVGVEFQIDNMGVIPIPPWEEALL